jgi:hypothetical protein
LPTDSLSERFTHIKQRVNIKRLTVTGTTNNNCTTHVGASIEANVVLQLGADLPGHIDNFAVWDRPLTEMEMTKSLYPAKRAEDAVSGLVYDFLFDECNDGSTVDFIGTN